MWSICSFLRIWSHLLKKSLMEKFIFCAVKNGKYLIECYGNYTAFDFEHKLKIFMWYSLTLSWLRSLLYRNQGTDVQSKSMECFLYDKNLPQEGVKMFKCFIKSIGKIEIPSEDISPAACFCFPRIRFR